MAPAGLRVNFNPFRTVFSLAACANTKMSSGGGEEKFEFVQLPRDVQTELQAEAKETTELFQKW